MGYTVSREERSIKLKSNEEEGVWYCSNYSDNCRYNWFTFVPVALFNYFKVFFNLYFLAMTISQFIPIFDVGYRFTYILPLGACTLFFLVKELVDDCKRRKGDKETNNLIYEKMTIAPGEALEKKDLKNWNCMPTKWADLQVGDIIKVKPGQVIPADVVLMAREDNNEEVFISTAQLDGETDSKQRVPVFKTK
jgi:phospholipid-translocating ATPase